MLPTAAVMASDVFDSLTDILNTSVFKLTSECILAVCGWYAYFLANTTANKKRHDNMHIYPDSCKNGKNLKYANTLAINLSESRIH